MTNESNPTVTPRRTQWSARRWSVIVYLLTAVGLWLWYPRSPRATVDLGSAAQFSGFTPNGQSLVVFNPGKSIQFWSMHSGKREQQLQADEQEWAPPIEFSRDGKRLSVRHRSRMDVSGEQGSMGCDFYDVASGTKLSTVHFSRNLKTFVATSPDGALIAAGEHDGTQVYDTATGDLRCKVAAGTAAAFSDDHKTLAVGTKTDAGGWAVKLFDPNTGAEQRMLAEGVGIVNGLAFSPAGTKFAIVVFEDTFTPSETRGIQLWDIPSQTCEQILPLNRDDVANLGQIRFLADGQVIATAGFFRNFAWDHSVPAPDNLVGTTGLSAFPPVLSSDGRLAAVLDVYARTITVRRLGTGKVEIVRRLDYTHSAQPLAITPENRLIVAADPEGQGLRRMLAKVFPSLGKRYEVIDLASGKLLGTAPLVTGAAAIGVSPDGRTLVTNGYLPKTRGEFTFWNLPTATPWLAILGFAAFPAALIGWSIHRRAA